MQLSRHSRVQVGIVPSKHTPTCVFRVVAATSVVGSEQQTWKDDFSSLDDRKVRLSAASPKQCDRRIHCGAVTTYHIRIGIQKN
jgi:hypothetical protein